MLVYLPPAGRKSRGKEYMKRTISAMVGKGSLNHNSRKFHAKNTDPERSCFNVEYCNKDIREVYHQLFDEALEKYNAKQKRSDRVIPDYYEKIRSGKQEKPFHELIIQIGNKDDMSAQSEDGSLAAQILDEYMRDFQARNPNLRVFAAHLHMDEATPHLHIDFVPFTTLSKRGLETRVSLKKALEAQGFKGTSRSDTEWNRWANREKEQLAAIMERHGIEWEQKGTHEEHLDVLDYKKKVRSQEVAALDAQAQQLQVTVNQREEQVAELDAHKQEREVQVERLEETISQQTEEIAGLDEQRQEKQAEAEALDRSIQHKQAEADKVEQTLAKIREKKVKVTEIEDIKPKPIPLSNQVMLSRKDFDTLTTAAEQYVVQRRQEGSLRKLLNEAMARIQELESIVKEKVAEIAALRRELNEAKSLRGRLSAAKVEVENRELRRENQALREENRGLRSKLAELGVGFVNRVQQKTHRMER